MRKSKKRVIAIITCCFVLATFCVGVFADEVTTSQPYDYNSDRLGMYYYQVPYDLGDFVGSVQNHNYGRVYNDYYIVKFTCNHIPANDTNISLFDNNIVNSVIKNSNEIIVKVTTYNSQISDIYLEEGQSVYVYVFYGNVYINYSEDNQDGYYVSCDIYRISDTSVIDSVYANSQDVNSSLVSVINEATNVITTNDVVMMFCILIPVISFGVGILIRLRKRS